MSEETFYDSQWKKNYNSIINADQYRWRPKNADDFESDIDSEIHKIKS